MSKQILLSAWISILMLCGITPSDAACDSKQIANTDGCEWIVREHKHKYIAFVKDVESKIKLMKFGGIFSRVFASLGGHSKKDLENAGITWRFFKSGRALHIARDIGNQPADCAYIASVYAEFYSTPSRSFEKLVDIMHRRMMEALGFAPSTTISDFLKIMDATDKKGRYKAVHGAQFDIYARLIALNMFIAYWHDAQ